MSRIVAISGTEYGVVGADAAATLSMATKLTWGVLLLTVVGIFWATTHQTKGKRS